MGGHAYDGTPLQSGADGVHRLTGVDHNFSAIGFREMVVVGIKYVDDKRNRSQSSVEYTCRDMLSGDIVTSVRRIVMVGGIEDGDDAPLRASSVLTSGTGDINDRTPAERTDGDRVLVGFVDGARSRPVIIGVFQHTRSTYGARRVDGQRRLTTHKGTTIEIRSNGGYAIRHKSGATFILLDNGDIEIQPAAGGKVRVRSDGGVSRTLAFKDELEAVDQKYDHHIHLDSMGGPTGEPLKTVASGGAIPNLPNPLYPGTDPINPFLDEFGAPTTHPYHEGAGLDAVTIDGTQILEAE